MAFYSTLSLDYQTLLTTTLMKVLSTNVIQDQVFNANPLLTWLRSGNRVKVIDGGERIRIPLMTGKNSTSGSYDSYEILDTAGLGYAYAA